MCRLLKFLVKTRTQSMETLASTQVSGEGLEQKHAYLLRDKFSAHTLSQFWGIVFVAGSARSECNETILADAAHDKASERERECHTRGSHSIA